MNHQNTEYEIEQTLPTVFKPNTKIERYLSAVESGARVFKQKLTLVMLRLRESSVRAAEMHNRVQAARDEQHHKHWQSFRGYL